MASSSRSNCSSKSEGITTAAAPGTSICRRIARCPVTVEAGGYQQVSEIKPQVGCSWVDGLQLRWIAILRPHLSNSLAASTGGQTSKVVLKPISVGADLVMIAGALLRHEPTRLRTMRDGIPA
jgi:hypothetical protein